MCFDLKTEQDKVNTLLQRAHDFTAESLGLFPGVLGTRHSFRRASEIWIGIGFPGMT